MAEVVVVGGYGRVGTLCVRALLQRGDMRVVVAGRNAQRAESSALSHGDRAVALYLDAEDPRTPPESLAGAAALIVCGARAPFALFDLALRARVPLVSCLPLRLDHATRTTLGKRAWEAGVPLVLAAGASPGLAGVAAEWLVRRFERLDEIRVVSSGADTGGDPPAGVATDAGRRSRRARATWRFPAPLGWRLVRAVDPPDLEGFAEQHVVERVTCLERDRRAPVRVLERALGRADPRGFALVAEAFSSPSTRVPDAAIRFECADPAAAAAASLAILVRALLDGGLPAGLLLPREALNPGTYVDALQKCGVRVRC